MPRPRDHRDVSFRITQATPKFHSVLFDVHFDPEQDWFSSTMHRKVTTQLASEESQHEAKIVLPGDVHVGTVSWERLANARVELPGIKLRAELVEPDATPLGWPLAWPPSGAVDRTAQWNPTSDSLCRVRVWVRAGTGYTATISPSASPPYSITFKQGATGPEYRCLLAASVRSEIMEWLLPQAIDPPVPNV